MCQLYDALTRAIGQRAAVDEHAAELVDPAVAFSKKLGKKGEKLKIRKLVFWVN